MKSAFDRNSLGSYKTFDTNYTSPADSADSHSVYTARSTFPTRKQEFFVSREINGP